MDDTDSLFEPTLTERDEPSSFSRPWNPRALLLVAFFVGAGASAALYASNFRRLGIRGRAIPTLLIGLVWIAFVSHLAGRDYVETKRAARREHAEAVLEKYAPKLLEMEAGQEVIEDAADDPAYDQPLEPDLESTVQSKREFRLVDRLGTMLIALVLAHLQRKRYKRFDAVSEPGQGGGFLPGLGFAAAGYAVELAVFSVVFFTTTGGLTA